MSNLTNGKDIVESLFSIVGHEYWPSTEILAGNWGLVEIKHHLCEDVLLYNSPFELTFKSIVYNSNYEVQMLNMYVLDENPNLRKLLFSIKAITVKYSSSLKIIYL